jgi:predicted nucleotidyltransferase
MHVIAAKNEIIEIREALAPVFKKNNVTKVVLFGSVSRASQTKKSDFDLMIITRTDKRFFERYDPFDIIHDIVKDRSVDLLIYTADELSRISHRPFIKKILSEGDTIYES